MSHNPHSGGTNVRGKSLARFSRVQGPLIGGDFKEACVKTYATKAPALAFNPTVIIALTTL